MEVILLENIKKLGKIGSKVKVANGFARNYLLKNNKSLVSSKENLAIFEKRKEELNKKNNNQKNEAVKIQKEIDKFELKITKNSMEGGALYGSLTIKEIIQNLETIFTIQQKSAERKNDSLKKEDALKQKEAVGERDVVGNGRCAVVAIG